MIWDVLGIHPTKDADEIKKAYARLAKQFNPEEHPDEFRRIHDAFKDAMKFAKGKGNTSLFANSSENTLALKSDDEINVRTTDSDSVSDSLDDNYNFNEIFKKSEEDRSRFSFVDEIVSSAETSKIKNNHIINVEQVVDELKKIVSDYDLCNSIYVWNSLFSNIEVMKILKNPDNTKLLDKILERVRFNKTVANELKKMFGNKTSIVYNYEHDVYYLDLTGKRKLEYYTVGAKKYLLKNVLRYVLLFLILIAFILLFIAACFY